MKSKTELETIAVIGLGYVGLPLAIRAAEKGYAVVGIDTDSEKVESIKKGVSPFHDDALTARLANVSLAVSTTPSVIARASTVVVCVPTPVHEDHSPDLTPLISATKSIAPYLSPNTLVIIESTVNPGVCEEVVLPILLQGSNLTVNRTLLLAHCPERINPGDVTWHVGNIPRVVGAFNSTAMQRALRFYKRIVDGDVRPMQSLAAAEAVKMVENSFRDINIAFVNELAMSFDKLGIDVVDVIEGAATKPFAFMPHFPGCGVGGHCIPVDPYYLIEYGRKNGFAHRFLSIARYINNEMPRFTVDMLENALLEKRHMLSDTPIAVLGLSYKANIDDCRESPAFSIIREIQARGGTTIIYDPFCLDRSDEQTLAATLQRAGAVVVATDHNVFKKMTPEVFAKHDIDVVVDGRNCLSKSLFQNSPILYRGIGRDTRDRMHTQSARIPAQERTKEASPALAARFA